MNFGKHIKKGLNKVLRLHCNFSRAVYQSRLPEEARGLSIDEMTREQYIDMDRGSPIKFPMRSILGEEFCQKAETGINRFYDSLSQADEKLAGRVYDLYKATSEHEPDDFG
jgi:hypothetical protein